MNVVSIKTHKISQDDKNILKILDLYIEKLEENSVVAITSKIVSICEGSIKKIDGKTDKDELIRENSQLFLPRTKNKYNISFTISNNILSASAGIDESNGNGFYVLWPKNPQNSVNNIWEHLRAKFNLKNLGVIISDSKTTPLRWGVSGICLAHCGFVELYDYIGKPDLFGRPFEYEKLNIADSLASAAVLEMGEGSEQTPIAIISGVKNIVFQDKNPSDEELAASKIKIEDDLFGEFLNNAPWKKGGQR